jgi:glycosyltransferase involved in cell wall biosynthesis
MELEIIDSKPLIETVAIVTPTTGKPTLRQNLLSVQNQTFEKVTQFVVVDGPEFLEKAYYQLPTEQPRKVHIQTLAENVGANGWYGHRVYAAFSFLTNADAICFLDEDNWIEPNHVEELVKALNDKAADWAFSFRKIYDKDGNYLCHDNCESLGVHPVYFDDKIYHVDTSSYCVRKDVAVRVAGAWYGQWGADRQYFGTLAQHFGASAAFSKQHSLCYRLDGNPGSVSKEFFDQGNAAMQARYGNNLPWLV